MSRQPFCFYFIIRSKFVVLNVVLGPVLQYSFFSIFYFLQCLLSFVAVVTWIRVCITMFRRAAVKLISTISLTFKQMHVAGSSPSASGRQKKLASPTSYL